MPQSLLPMIPEGASRISDLISVVRENGVWTYFCGVHPVFCHPEADRRSFRMFTAQLVCQGACREVDILRVFGVSKNSVKRSVKKYREEGIEGFYGARKRRGATVLTPAVTAEAQRLLNTGRSRREVAEELAIKCDTLRKAIQQGRLQELPGPVESAVASDKSQRSNEDVAAEMGTACTRPVERVLAALGMLEGAPTRFEPCRDVSYGGVLCALPGLIENGLLRHLDQVFPTLTGYYTTMHVLLLLGYLALCRIKTVERLQYEPPGELGKLLGLDRVPEVRCLRQKMADLGCDDAAGKWAGLLSRDWMEASPELAGALYVDGHVRLYHGQQTELPRRYVARQRLCLRGTTDYWVNDALGQPFFVIERPIDHGMLEVLRSDVVPRLLHDVPGQPNEEQLKQDPYRARFVLIFDREGYSPAFFKEMWDEHRIACITYHKYPKDPWPETEFLQTEITLPNGEQVSLKLAERGSWIGNRHEGLWVREIRKLTTSGHQTSLISSAYGQLAEDNAAALFSRWSQENFFRYMMEHFAIDLLSEYGTEAIPGTTKPVVNPNWRELDRQSRTLKGKLVQRQARFAAMTLHPESDEKEVSKWEERKTELVEELEQLEHELDQVKQRLKETPKHVLWDELPAEQKFHRLASSRKRLTDTVKMIAYRAETAMMAIVREELAREDDARALLRELFRSEADLSPNTARGVLEVRVHPMANPRSNRAIAHLLTHLNEASFTYPGTNLKLVYVMPGVPQSNPGPPEIPRNQDI
jgi:transposase